MVEKKQRRKRRRRSGVKIRWGEREEKKRAKKVERKPAYFYTSTQPEYAALIAV